MTTPPMRRSWLVQRLEPPRRPGILGKDNPFAFGAGLRNGGLSDEAMGLLRDVFSFDYMGAAEFELGAVPKALQGLAKDATEIVAFDIQIERAQVPRHWRDKTTTVPSGYATVHVLCRKPQQGEVAERINAWATSERDGLMERTNLSSVLRPDPSEGAWVPETCGWLELDNGFLFFTDREMFEKTAALFGVQVQAAAA